MFLTMGKGRKRENSYLLFVPGPEKVKASRSATEKLNVQAGAGLILLPKPSSEQFSFQSESNWIVNQETRNLIKATSSTKILIFSKLVKQTHDSNGNLIKIDCFICGSLSRGIDYTKIWSKLSFKRIYFHRFLMNRVLADELSRCW